MGSGSKHRALPGGDSMLPSVGFHKFGFGVLGLALVFMLGLSAFPGSPNGQPGAHPESTTAATTKQTLPNSAPPVTVDSVLPNLFYGATPLTTATPIPGPCASTTECPTPVLVFVHGLSGTYADWLESNNCPPAPTPCAVKSSPADALGNDMYDFAYEARSEEHTS